MKTKPAPKTATLIPRRKGKNGNLPTITQKEFDAFNAVIAAEVAPYIKTDGEFAYAIDTDFGTLTIAKPYPVCEKETTYWVYMCLCGSDEQRTKALHSGLDLASVGDKVLNGKWNFYNYHPQDAIDELKRRLLRVKAKPVALHAAAKEFFSSLS